IPSDVGKRRRGKPIDSHSARRPRPLHGGTRRATRTADGFTGHPMVGYVYVAASGVRTESSVDEKDARRRQRYFGGANGIIGRPATICHLPFAFTIVAVYTPLSGGIALPSGSLPPVTSNAHVTTATSGLTTRTPSLHSEVKCEPLNAPVCSSL